MRGNPDHGKLQVETRRGDIQGRWRGVLVDLLAGVRLSTVVSVTKKLGKWVEIALWCSGLNPLGAGQP